MTKSLNRLMRGGFVLLIYSLVAGAVFNSFMQKSGLQLSQKEYGFRELMSATACRPFCYRVLVPFLVNTVAKRVPPSAIQHHRDWLLHGSPILRYEKESIAKGPWTVDLSVKYHLTYFICYFAMFAFVLLLRYLLIFVYHPPALARDYGPVALVLLLPITFAYGGYPYDFPELAFSSLYLIFLVRGRMLGALLAFAIACLNKESDVLLFIFFAALGIIQNRNRKFLIWGAAQVLVGAIIVLWLHYAFRFNGRNAMWNLSHSNFRFWRSPRAYTSLISPYAPLIRAPRGLHVLTVAFLAWAIFTGRKASPGWLKWGTLALAITFCPLVLIGGYRDEFRACGCIFPALFVLIFPSLFGGDSRPAEPQSSH